MCRAESIGKFNNQTSREEEQGFVIILPGLKNKAIGSVQGTYRLERSDLVLLEHYERL